jgi:excisionase family DNA binding protein
MARRPPADSQWVTVGAAARLIGVHHSYVRILVDTGRLRAKRTSFGIRLIDRVAVERFARERARRLAASHAHASLAGEGSIDR